MLTAEFVDGGCAELSATVTSDLRALVHSSRWKEERNLDSSRKWQQKVSSMYYIGTLLGHAWAYGKGRTGRRTKNGVGLRMLW